MKRLIARSLLSALVLVLLTSGCSFGGGGRTLVAEFAEVGDLVGRANVQQADAVVGTVASIDLVERPGEWVARVTMRLSEDAQVREGTRATVRATSLLGEKFVDLESPKEGSDLPSGAVLPVAQTAKAPELEQLLTSLGGLLETGALEDLAAITSAGAMILEGQEDTFGRVLDQTAKVVASLHRQKDSLASSVSDLAAASKTLAAGSDTLGRALDVGDDALGIVADQQQQLDDLVVQLDRLGGPLGNLTRAHQGDIDAQVKDLRKVIPRLYEVRETLREAVRKLPDFTRLFARAAPGDYIQLDILAQAVPIDLSTLGANSSMASIFMQATEAASK